MQPRSFRSLRLVLVALGVVAGLVVTACGDSSSEDEADVSPISITFDGTTATYEGPDTIEPSFDIRLVNDSDDVVDFAYGRLAPDSDVTLEEAREWGETATDAPPWIEEGNHFSMNVPATTTVDEHADLMMGHRYEFVVWDVTTEHAYFAAWVDIRAN
jgi:hypothetical protein